MDTKLINSNIPQLFPTLEHWQSFVELAKQWDNIHESIVLSATQKIRQHFQATLPDEWSMKPCHATKRDTQWFLTENGAESISVIFNWYYHLCIHSPAKFKPIVPQLIEFLESEKGQPVERAFERIDERGHHHALLREMRNFNFGQLNDGNYDEYDLAYLINQNEQSFIDQAISKIERFTKNDEVTQSLSNLNHLADQAILATY